jgi:hypothetical protein
MASPSVRPAQRFTTAHPCPVCRGHAQAARGQGVRCWGFLSSDGTYAHCSRDEYAGALPIESNGTTYAHQLTGDCRCGVRHDPSPPPVCSTGHVPHRPVSHHASRGGRPASGSRHDLLIDLCAWAVATQRLWLIARTWDALEREVGHA